MAAPRLLLLLLLLLACVLVNANSSRFAKAYAKRDHSDYSSPCNPKTLQPVPQLGTLGSAPVILIPGIGGSSLWAQDEVDGPYDHAWLTAMSADCQDINIPYKWQPPSGCSTATGCECVIPEHLLSKYNVTSGRTESVGGFGISAAYNGFGLCSVADLAPDVWSEKTYMFQPMIQHLKSMGYVPGENLWGFPYDWRQSNFNEFDLELLRDLVAYVHDLTGMKAVLISHSMGGLKTLSYLSKFPANFSENVQAWIAIACPFQGAPASWNSFVQGYNLGVNPPALWKFTGLSNTTAHQLVMQFPSIYELLPSPTFSWQSTPKMEFYQRGVAAPLKYTVTNADSVLQNINGLNEVTYAFDGIYDKYWNSWQTVAYSRALEHRQAWSSIPYVGEPFKFINIAAESISTPHSFAYTMTNRLLDTWGSVPEITYTSGDGTVPLESAFGDAAIQAVTSAENYHRHTVTDAPDHVQILRSPQTMSLVDSYLKNCN